MLDYDEPVTELPYDDVDDEDKDQLRWSKPLDEEQSVEPKLYLLKESSAALHARLGKVSRTPCA